MKTQGEFFMVKDMIAQGYSVSAIAKALGMDRKTVRRYAQGGVECMGYGPRARRRESCLDAYKAWLSERIKQVPGVSARRLQREITEMGYSGKYTGVKAYVRSIRPVKTEALYPRFETAPGEQAQVDFAHFWVNFGRSSERRRVWLFSLVLGFSRYLYGCFVERQDLETLIQCHERAFGELGGVTQHILYDRMKTVVLGEDDEGRAKMHPTFADFAKHYGFVPRVCRPYRPQTKGKVERPFRYIRQDFFAGRTWEDLADLNAQFDGWRADVCNARVHATTGRVVREAFAEEQPHLGSLAAFPYTGLMQLGPRRVSRDGMISVEGHLVRVPDNVVGRKVHVALSAESIHILQQGHPLSQQARHQKSVPCEHGGSSTSVPCLPHASKPPQTPSFQPLSAESCSSYRQGTQAAGLVTRSVMTRPLDCYEQIGKVLAAQSAAAGVP